MKYIKEKPHEGEEICHVYKKLRHSIFVSIVRGQCPDRHGIQWEGGANETLHGQLILKKKIAAYHNILVEYIQRFVFLFHIH